MELPAEIAEFLDDAPCLDNPVLPQHYLDPDHDRPAAGGPLGGGEDWDEDWLLLGSNRDGDCYFVDLAEMAAGYPVYFRYTDESAADVIEVSGCLDDFAEMLSLLGELESEPRDALDWVRHHQDTTTELWAAVCEAYRVAQVVTDQRAESRSNSSRPDGWAGSPQTAGSADEPAVPQSYAMGSLVVTDLGDDAAAVIAHLARLKRTSEAQIERAALSGEIFVRRDRWINLEELHQQLLAWGADADFRVEEA